MFSDLAAPAHLIRLVAEGGSLDAEEQAAGVVAAHVAGLEVAHVDPAQALVTAAVDADLPAGLDGARIDQSTMLRTDGPDEEPAS